MNFCVNGNAKATKMQYICYVRHFISPIIRADIEIDMNFYFFIRIRVKHDFNLFLMKKTCVFGVRLLNYIFRMSFVNFFRHCEI
jgi:hypothetical protein